MTLIAKNYWESRYASGGGSGAGSEGQLCQHKADHINRVLQRADVGSVVDWGCGDGVLLSLLDLDTATYVGVDVSPSGLVQCAKRNPRHTLLLWREGCPVPITADLALSIDILFHFPDDAEYETYLQNLFGSARELVLVHTCEQGPDPHPHVRWRTTSQDVRARFPEWELTEITPGINEGHFYLYQRRR